MKLYKIEYNNIGNIKYAETISESSITPDETLRNGFTIMNIVNIYGYRKMPGNECTIYINVDYKCEYDDSEYIKTKKELLIYLRDAKINKLLE